MRYDYGFKRMQALYEDVIRRKYVDPATCQHRRTALVIVADEEVNGVIVEGGMYKRCKDCKQMLEEMR